MPTNNSGKAQVVSLLDGFSICTDYLLALRKTVQGLAPQILAFPELVSAARLVCKRRNGKRLDPAIRRLQAVIDSMDAMMRDNA